MYVSIRRNNENYNTTYMTYNFMILISCLTKTNQLYLRHRKHFLCLFSIIEILEKVLVNDKCCRNTAHTQVFQTTAFFDNKYFYKMIESLVSIRRYKHWEKKG